MRSGRVPWAMEDCSKDMAPWYARLSNHFLVSRSGGILWPTTALGS